jgi:hypothetical protein
MKPKNNSDENNLFVIWNLSAGEKKFSYETPESFWEIIDNLDCKYYYRLGEEPNEIEVTLFTMSFK